jgi:flavodoxin
MKSIILYYSRAGSTEKLAKKIQAVLSSDILKVEAEKAYGNFLSSVIRVLKERKKDIPPNSKTEIPNLDSYDTILVGYPIWAGDIPAFFAGFVGKCNLRGKKLIPFATSGGSGIEKSIETLKRVCPESNIVHAFDYAKSKKGSFFNWMQAIRGSES